MILKSYEIKKNPENLLKKNFFLLYGENFGLKKDIKEFITKKIKGNNKDLEILVFYENEIIENEEVFFNTLYSGSLFGSKKIVTIYDATDKFFKKIDNIFDKYSEDIYLIIFSDILEKKSKLRNFFEKNKNTICIPCYLDNDRDLETIAQFLLKKNNITLSRESINLLIEKSNADRSNLKNEIEKIISYSLSKKNIEFDEIKILVNFTGEHKSDNLINECLCGNILQYKKILSELYISKINHVLFLRILSNKAQRLLKIKEQDTGSNSIDSLISTTKPPVFWKEKPILRKQLSIWKINDLKKIISEINSTEFLCKKNPQVSQVIFFNFFSEICRKASSYS